MKESSQGQWGPPPTDRKFGKVVKDGKGWEWGTRVTPGLPLVHRLW